MAVTERFVYFAMKDLLCEVVQIPNAQSGLISVTDVFALTWSNSETAFSVPSNAGTSVLMGKGSMFSEKITTVHPFKDSLGRKASPTSSPVHAKILEARIGEFICVGLWLSGVTEMGRTGGES
mmetsp:Transcript_20810/g.48871  ORF Transcript_20810/g.48871 Transcript_20810/m.48871 type:complete len:123 (+) Transcript_20810:1016-1384(+)